MPAEQTFRFGGPHDDAVQDVAVTSNGSILAVGFESGGGDLRASLYEIKATNAPSQRALLNTSGADSFESIDIDDGGTAWIVARTNGDIAGMPTYGDHDSVLGTLSSSGLSPLVRGFDSVPEFAQRVAAGPTGIVAMAGYERRMMLGGAEWVNPFVAAYANTENGLAPRWFHTRRAPEDERYTAVDASADRIVVGGAIASGDHPGMFVTAFDSDAAHLWTRSLTTSGADRIAAVHVTTDNDVLWLGTAAETVNDEGYGGSDIVLGRLEGASGLPIFTRRYGHVTDERARDMVVDAQGRIHVIASVVGPHTGEDLDLLVVSETGALLVDEWRPYGGRDEPTSIAIDPCGSVVIVGQTEGQLGGAGLGGRDAFVLVTRPTY